jgi:hypothetical protein
MTSDFRALCAEMIFIWTRSTNPDDLFENMIPLIDRAHAALAEDPVGPTDEESNAFAIVQMRLDDLAGDQELMIYRWPKAGDWDIQHTNPFSSVQLGEINGKYSCAGTTLEEAVRKLANALPAPSLKEQALELAKPAGIAGAYVTFGPEELDTIRKALEALPND